jgi:hypothetical protein
MSWVLMTHTNNPCYSGSRDHEDQGSMQTLANSLQDLILKTPNISWVLVAHTCNPSYSRGRDQEDSCSSQHGQIVQEPMSKKPFTKKGW